MVFEVISDIVIERNIRFIVIDEKVNLIIDGIRKKC